MISRSNGVSSSNKPRNAGHLLANAALAAVLVLAHQYYLTLRLSVVKWFLIERAPGGCLPIPSRTLYEPILYKFHDAVANNLVWGTVASYAVAMSITFGNSLTSTRGTSVISILSGALGALLIGIVAASALPMCDGTVENAEMVTASVDRGPEWHERTPMEWPDEARYRTLPAAITVMGILGVFVDALLRQGLGRKIRAADQPKQANGHVQKDKEGKWVDVASEVAETGNLAALLTNLLLTITVVMGMAIWSYVGAKPKDDNAPSLPGLGDWKPGD